jgi:hypothetical protein
MQLLRQEGWVHVDEFFEVLRSLHFDWAIEKIGKPIPALKADFWRGQNSIGGTWPVLGKVSIYLHCGPVQQAPSWWSPSRAARWQRLARKYGNAVNITMMCKTQGYLGDGPPLTTIGEADQLSSFLVDSIKLPVTVAVDTTIVQQLADGRRLLGKAPFEQDPYYHWDFIMTDQEGNILLILPSIPEEPALDALVERVLKH